jgi:hypothetical protein
MTSDIDKAYISPYDKFLADFDKKHPQKSKSEQEEIDTHKEIAKKRDDPEAGKGDSILWEGF